MSDTLDLLEAVGRDASLRRLPADELAQTLQDAGASDALATATRAGDRAALSDEFGFKLMGSPQISQGLPFEEEKEEGDEEGEDGEEKPSLPTKSATH